MKLEEFRDMIDKDVFQPYVIKTKGGRAYPVKHESSIWMPPEYESTVCVAVSRKGITLIDVDSIEAVQFEHHVTAFD